MHHVLNKKSINTCKNYIYQYRKRPQSTEAHGTERNNDTDITQIEIFVTRVITMGVKIIF